MWSRLEWLVASPSKNRMRVLDQSSIRVTWFSLPYNSGYPLPYSIKCDSQECECLNLKPYGFHLMGGDLFTTFSSLINLRGTLCRVVVCEPSGLKNNQ